MTLVLRHTKVCVHSKRRFYLSLTSIKKVSFVNLPIITNKCLRYSYRMSARSVDCVVLMRVNVTNVVDDRTPHFSPKK